MSIDVKRYVVPLLLAALGLAYLVPALVAAQGNPNPFAPSNRGYGNAEGRPSVDELVQWMEPCERRARESLPEIAARYRDGVPEDTRVLVTTRRDNPIQQFYVFFDYLRDGIVFGRMGNDMYVGEEWFDYGDPYDVPLAEVVDWTISRPGQPNEGDLLGKFALRVADGLLVGPCDPDDAELTRFRTYQPGYSFAPPIGDGWVVSPGEGAVDVSIQRDDIERDMLDTVFSIRFRLRKRVAEMSDVDFADWFIESEADLIDDQRSRALEHTVVRSGDRAERCFRSNEVVEDSQALRRSTGERVLMLREHIALICFHPENPRLLVSIDYMHRHPVGVRDASVDARAAVIFESLAFTDPYQI